MAGLFAVLVHQCIGIVDDADAGDGVDAHVAADHQGLGIGIGNAADAHITVELDQVLFELGTEGGVVNAVDLALEALALIVDNHTCPTGSQVGVVVHAEEDIILDVALCDCAEEAAHRGYLLKYVVIPANPGKDTCGYYYFIMISPACN